MMATVWGQDDCWHKGRMEFGCVSGTGALYEVCGWLRMALTFRRPFPEAPRTPAPNPWSH